MTATDDKRIIFFTRSKLKFRVFGQALHTRFSEAPETAKNRHSDNYRTERALMKKILVTGATGFIGRPLCKRLKDDGHEIRITLMSPDETIPKGVSETVVIGDIAKGVYWGKAVAGVDVVIHLAARVHHMREGIENPYLLYRKVNTEGTISLAEEAILAGVKRIIFISTVKVHGEGSDSSYCESDACLTEDPYALSKLKAEQALSEIGKGNAIEVVIFRPPLIYGPGVRANFLRLLRFVDKGYPWPFGRLLNGRSILYVGNMVDAIALVVEHSAAAGGIFLISDGENLSTPELYRRIAFSLGRRAVIFPFDGSLFALVLRAIGRGDLARRLLGSLTVDTSKIQNTLGWKPKFSIGEGLAETAKWYRSNRKYAGH